MKSSKQFNLDVLESRLVPTTFLRVGSNLIVDASRDSVAANIQVKDRVVVNYSTNDVYQFGTEVKSIQIEGSKYGDELWLQRSPCQVFANTHGGNDFVNGSQYDDTVNGGDGDDRLVGNGGSDTLLGGSGNDVILGGFGNDRLSGGSGNDTIEGEYGSDRISGDEGDDVLRGGTQNDTIEGGNGNDYIEGGEDNDKIYGNDGNDGILGENGNDLLFGGNGDDFIKGGSGADDLYGEDGNDRLEAGENSSYNKANSLLLTDELFGGRGNDTLIGRGSVSMTGGEGVDTFLGEEGCPKQVAVLTGFYPGMTLPQYVYQDVLDAEKGEVGIGIDMILYNSGIRKQNFYFDKFGIQMVNSNLDKKWIF